MYRYLYTVYKYIHSWNSRISSTPYLSACGPLIYSELWPLPTVTQRQTCSTACSGTPTQAFQSETLQNHFKSCAHSSSSRQWAPPAVSVLPLFTVAPPSCSGYKQFTHLFCCWKWASLTFQEASWRRHRRPAQVQCATASASAPHSGKQIVPIILPEQVQLVLLKCITAVL